MASTLTKDAAGAAYFLDKLTPIPGTPIEINILGLRAVIAVIGKPSAINALRRLKSRLADSPGFDFGQSPLRHLVEGLRNRDPKLSSSLEAVFDAFNGAAA